MCRRLHTPVAGGPRTAVGGTGAARAPPYLMVNPLVRSAAPLLFAVALSITPGLARADEADEASSPKSIEDYQEAIAAQESQVSASRDGNAGNGARARLEKLAAEWRIDVRFLGTIPRRETLVWIASADELVHASIAEGMSTVVREAEHLGVKVTVL